MIVMNPRILLDTNVLVYVYDTSAPLKRTQALSVLGALADAGIAAVSTQVLAEFFSVTSRRALTPEMALAELQHHVRVWTVLEITSGVVLSAARGVLDHQLNFWDAQLWATAKVYGVETILSEDFNSGSTLGGVSFVNPFARGFRLPNWTV
jgi:predicted nucleic acid-binding protein